MRHFFFSCVGALAFLVVSSAAQSVHINYNKGFDFRQVHTFSWGQVQTRNSEWNDEARLDIDNALRARGLTEVPSGGDLEISVMSTTKVRRQLETFYNNGWGMGWGWRGWRGGPWFAETVPVRYPENTLVIDFFNPQNKELVWRGTATQALSNGNPGRNDQRLNDAVKKLLGKFPPKR
ncbi:MAG TPA: DUF4136 domain-containing protein [Terriglobales bacterium]|nr:DUF4136 domain-containing protein [Terriglobales bacterium]